MKTTLGMINEMLSNASKHLTSKGSIAHAKSARAGLPSARRCFGRYESMKKILTIILLLLSLPLIAENKGKEVLPHDVYALFYAIKNSLDYGYIEGVSEPNFPKNKLIDYRRVDEESLTKLNDSYFVENYEATKDDYILILASKSDGKKYKATRMTISYLKNYEWVNLGGYYYQ